MEYPKEQWSPNWWERSGNIDPKRKGLYPGQLNNMILKDDDNAPTEIEECKS
jgi:hypothetical protein